MMHSALSSLAAAWLLAAGGAQDEEGFEPLFNGQDLTGWVGVNTAPSTWTVKDGMLHCSGKPIGELRTTRMYQNFVLEVEWRHLVPKGNAGIFVWADDITARGVPFHRSIEVQVLENAYGNTRSHTTHGDIFPIHGAVMTPINGRGGSRAFPTENRSKPSPEWNHYRITCDDGSITLAVNGEVVTRGEDCSPRKGYICLESEGGVVDYRNLRIKELPDTPVDPDDVAIADRGYRCLYNGIDLSGWTVYGGSGTWTPKDWVLAYDAENHTGDPSYRSIGTTESFGDFGFVVDVRRRADRGVPEIGLRSLAGFRVDPEDPEIGPRLVKGWNRFEGELRGDLLTLAVNGSEVFLNRWIPGLPEQGSLWILPSGEALEVANVFVRELE